MLTSRDYINCLKTNRKLPFPFLIQLEITNECPFNCPQCYKTESGNTHMDFDSLKKNVEYCYKNGTRIFVLNGGEPTLYYQFVKLVQFLNLLDIQINCFSSGYGLTEEIINIWDFDQHRFSISLNGSSEEINSLSRQGYSDSIAALENLSKRDKKTEINWVARHNNLNDFPNLIRLCEFYNVKTISVTSEKLSGNGGIMSPLDREDLCSLATFISSYNGKVDILVESCFPTLNSLLPNNRFNYFMGCFAGKYGCHINMDFLFSPCTHLAYLEKFDTVGEYWDQSSIIKLLNDTYEDTLCSRCSYHKNCKLCRAWDEDTYTNFSSSYLSCPIYNPIQRE